MTEVTIQNFQSIKDVSFSIEGFTVIVGRNNIGKSAVIRAIDAALTNQVGSDFIRHGEKHTTVRIKRGNLDIIWNKGDKASYMVNKESFTALNRDIPKPLLEAGFGKMEMGDQKVNPTLASQFDPLFLLNKGGSVVTEVLASLYDLDTLNIADEACQKELKSQKSLLKTRDADLLTCQKDLAKYAGFEEVKADVEKLVLREQECNRLKAEIEKLKEYEERLRALDKSVKSLERVKGVAVPDVKICGAKVVELKWIAEQGQKVAAFIHELNSLKKVVNVTVPDMSGIKKTLENLTYLIDAENRVRISRACVSNLARVKEMVSPDKLVSAVSGLLVEVRELSSFEKDMSVSTKSVEGLSTVTKINLKPVSDLQDRITSLISGHGELVRLADQYISCATTAKAAREDFRNAATQYESRQEEFNKLKVELGACPYCGGAFK